MIWDELSKAALMGTNRYQMPEEVLEALSRLGIDTREQAARAVLEGAAVYYNIQRAGFSLEKVASGVEVSEFSSETLKVPGGAIARYFQLVLSGRYFRVLPELLEWCKEYQVKIPAEHLAVLFNFSLSRPSFWASIQPLLEEKERWLLRQNPDWERLADLPPSEDEIAATIEEQAANLRFWRRTNPEKSLAFLESFWEESGYQEKRLLLQQFTIGLGSYDEAFLESCREDSRKEVRVEAAELLIDIPESALRKRLQQMATEIVEFPPGDKLQIHPPNPKNLPKGISVQKSKFKGSKQSVAAYEVFTRIPPRFWEEYTNRPIVDCLRLIGRSQQKRLLLHGIAEAALRFNDLRWVEAILRYWWRLDDTDNWSSALGKRLMVALPDPVFNEMIVQHFQQEAGLVEGDSFIGQLISLGAHHWESKITALIINGFQQWVNTSQSYYWNLWHYKRILKVAAYKANPSLLDSLRQGWNPRSPVWPQWEGEVERMLKTLAFRKDVKSAFEKNHQKN